MLSVGSKSTARVGGAPGTSGFAPAIWGVNLSSVADLVVKATEEVSFVVAVCTKLKCFVPELVPKPGQ